MTVKRKSPREKHPVEVAVEGIKQEIIIEALETDTKQLITIPKEGGKIWVPKTDLGKKVVSGEITNIDQILDKGMKIMEYQIVDRLIPDLEVVLIEVGQSKGKFGGGKGSIWKQTQKKVREGNRVKFSTLAFVGNRDGYVGIGFAGSKETVPAREKAIRTAKLNLIKVPRGCGGWACGCGQPHSIPIATKGKEGSVIIILKPAPKGTGLSVEKKCQKLLQLAGIKDAYSKTFGQTSTRLNLMKACYNALKNLSNVKYKDEQIKDMGIKV